MGNAGDSKAMRMMIARLITEESIATFQEGLFRNAVLDEIAQEKENDENANNSSTLSLENGDEETGGGVAASGSPVTVHLSFRAHKTSPVSPVSSPNATSFRQLPLSPCSPNATVNYLNETSLSINELCAAFARVSIASPPKQVVHIERFYNRAGTPIPDAVNALALQKAKQFFSCFNGNMISYRSVGELCLVVGFPYYWRRLVYNCCAFRVDCSRCDYCITFNDFRKFWERLTSEAHDEAARFVFVLSRGQRKFAIGMDFEPFIDDLVKSVASLIPIRTTPDFMGVYTEMVTCVILWSVSRSWNGRLTAEDIRKSDLIKCIRELDKENEELFSKSLYFSYDSFYVIYSKYVSYLSYCDGVRSCSIENLPDFDYAELTKIAAQRVVECGVPRKAGTSIQKPCNRSQNSGDVHKMSFSDFLYLMLASVMKGHRKGVEYWFRVMDLNGDGRISTDEMKEFYAEIRAKITELHPDDSCIPFENVASMLLDAVHPRCPDFYVLDDLRNSSMAIVFFNMFVDWKKSYQLQSCEESLISEKFIKEDGKNSMAPWVRYCTCSCEDNDVVEVGEQDNNEVNAVADQSTY